MSPPAADHRTNEKLDRIVQALHEVNLNLESLRIMLRGIETLTSDHEKRLRTIEKWQNNLTPVLAAMTFVLGVTFTQVLNRFW